jgi:enoyl-[acyl-carrier-protein] reductase (NADH)
VAPGGVMTNTVLAQYRANLDSIAEVDDSAAVHTFLSSDQAKCLSGTVVAADGGWSAV